MSFFKETFDRLTSKTPRYFRIIKTISVITSSITGIPLLLEQYHVVLPASISGIASSTVLIAALVGYTVAQLTKIEPDTHHSDVPEKLKQEEIKTKNGKI